MYNVMIFFVSCALENLRVVLMSNKRCGKVRLRQIYLNKRERVFVIFEVPALYAALSVLMTYLLD